MLEMKEGEAEIGFVKEEVVEESDEEANIGFGEVEDAVEDSGGIGGAPDGGEAEVYDE